MTEVGVLKGTLTINLAITWNKIESKIESLTPINDAYLNIYKIMICKLIFIIFVLTGICLYY